VVLHMVAVPPHRYGKGTGRICTTTGVVWPFRFFAAPRAAKNLCWKEGYEWDSIQKVATWASCPAGHAGVRARRHLHTVV